MNKYQWAPPEAMEGEVWWFYDHSRRGIQGLLLKGEVKYVDTHYSKGEAYHQFHMRVEGYSRRRVVGEESLVGPG